MTSWFVIVIFGNIVATIGPTSFETCTAMSKDANAQFDTKFAELGAANMPPVNDRTVERDDIYPACFVQVERPLLGERVSAN